MNPVDLERKLAEIPEGIPDEADKRMIANAQAVNDGSVMALSDVQSDIERYSGKILVRIPRSLHRKLVVDAKREGVSLNQYALYKLSR